MIHKQTPLILKTLEPKGVFWGYASTQTLDQSGDQILPGAFSKTLKAWQVTKNRFPHLLWEHDAQEFIGVCLELREDPKGLYIKGKLLVDEIQKAQDAYTLLHHGIKGLSIGFRIRSAKKEASKIRKILDLDLVEISFVQNPCNPEAVIHEFKTQDERNSDLVILDHLTTLLRR
jgi:HK97 family phage prohead protease